MTGFVIFYISITTFPFAIPTAHAVLNTFELLADKTRHNRKVNDNLAEVRRPIQGPNIPDAASSNGMRDLLRAT